MSTAIDVRILELLSARLCHELISPIGAIGNGVELLGEEDPEFVRDAVQLIGQSAKKASQRLQFYRFAYGTLGGKSAGGLTAAELVAGLLEGGKVACSWSAEAKTLEPEWQKLACNMAVLAAEALPRGGTVRIEASAGPELRVLGEGEAVNLHEESRAAIAGSAAIEALTSRTVQGYFTAHLAGRLGATIALTLGASEMSLGARLSPGLRGPQR